MVITDLENLAKQANLTPAMQKGLAFLRRPDLMTLPDGRVVIDGDTVYAEVQSYETKAGENEVYEAHRKYIDMQYVVDGDENMGWASIDRVAVTHPYNEEHDYLLGTVPVSLGTEARLKTGQLAVLFPTDAHAPRRAAGQSSKVKKIVVKVAVGQ